MKLEELNRILELHKKWLNNEDGGIRADLSNANLSGAKLIRANLSEADLSGAKLNRANLRGADLREADLSGANLRGADLSGANLSEAKLSGANLREADLSGANLRGANLRRADLSVADLSRANLRRADLSGANLSEAYLSGAGLSGVKYNEDTSMFLPQCPEGSFIAWKKAFNGLLIKLLIPEDAKRSSATTLKCRANKALVLDIEDLYGNKFEQAISNYDNTFIYKVGEVVKVKDFDEDRWNECSSGIHFFISKEMARIY